MNTHKMLSWTVVAVAVVAAAYVTFYHSTAQAVYSRALGDISVNSFVPYQNGTEYVELSFSGVLGRESTADLTGWVLSNGDGFTYGLSDVELTSTENVRLCGAGVDPSCDGYFPESENFNDQAGRILIKDATGKVVLEGAYVTPDQGEVLRIIGELNYFEDVYTSGDKVTICETQKNGALKLRKLNVQILVREMENATTAGADIVPPFVYEADKTTLGYHPGVNWPAGKDILARGCR